MKMQSAGRHAVSTQDNEKLSKGISWANRTKLSVPNYSSELIRGRSVEPTGLVFSQIYRSRQNRYNLNEMEEDFRATEESIGVQTGWYNFVIVFVIDKPEIGPKCQKSWKPWTVQTKLIVDHVIIFVSCH